MRKDILEIVVPMTRDNAVLELRSRLKSVINEATRALEALDEGKRLNSMMMGNHVCIDALAAKYNLCLELLPSLETQERVDSAHERREEARVEGQPPVRRRRGSRNQGGA